MKELQDRIVAYVTASNGLISLEKLLSVTSAKGFLEDQVLQALERIGKKLKSTVRGGVVYYQVAPAPKAPTDHLAWVNAHYPRPAKCEHSISYTECEHCMPFPSISYAHLFLKTKEERDLFISEMKGRPMMYNKKRYGN
jgi:hypothetical protein